MKILSITIHNFRSVEECTFNLNDYSLLIGANNAGKSNSLDAVRVFYEDGIKYDRNRDLPKFDSADDESWIEVEYKLTDNEYENLKEEWRQPQNRLRVRKYLDTKQKGGDKKPKIGIYAYTQDGLISDDLFYGAKNVQQGKLGDIIYIPAASKLDEHTKLSGPSALREILNDILKKLVKTSASFQSLTTEFESFSKSIKNEKTSEDKSILGLESDITAAIKDWGAAFELDINPVTDSDILKNLISYKIIDKTLDERMDASQFGQGFQRHLIFTLIRTAAKYQSSTISEKKKEFKPDLTLLLFEEPEAFLHPAQQNILCGSLKAIGSTEGHQIFVSSHSPHFVSQNSSDLPSLIRLCRNGDRTQSGQITSTTLDVVFSDNQQINSMLIGTKYEAEIDDLKEEMEAIKYFLWLNSERCGMFFSHLVLLVEGPTEHMLFNYLFDTSQIEMSTGGVFVLDCLGKFNIHRFMNILGPLKVRHAVLFDEDNKKAPHEKVRQLIEASRNDYTGKIDTFPDDIEAFLGIEKSKKAHRKPQHLMFKLQEGKIEEEKLQSLIEKVQGLIEI